MRTALVLAVTGVAIPLGGMAWTAQERASVEAVSIELQELTPTPDRELRPGQEVEFAGAARYALGRLDSGFLDVTVLDQEGYPIGDGALQLGVKDKTGVRDFSGKFRVPENVSALRICVELHWGRAMKALGNSLLASALLGQPSAARDTAVIAGKALETLQPATLAEDQVEFRVRVMQGTSQALFDAIEGGNVQGVLAQLEAGADPNSDAQSGRTALMLAAQRGNVEAAGVLLAAGAKVNKTDGMGTSALALASARGDAPLIHALLKSGAKVEKGNRRKATPLMFAAANGRVAAVSALLEAGADVNKRAAQDMTPLLVAAQAGHRDVVSVLLAHGAETEAVNFGGQTALMIAAARGDTETARALLESGAEVDRRDDAKRTALHWGIANGHESMVKLLLDQGAEADAVDEDRYTPLMRAARRGSADSVRALLAAGADATMRNRSGESAENMAVFCGHADVLAALGGPASAIAEWPEEAEYDTAPRPQRIEEPEDPAGASEGRVTGTVMVQILIDATGRVARASVLQSVAALDDAALEAVRQWRFEPATRNGEPVAAVAQAPITFGMR